MLDGDLADLHEVEVKAMHQAVNRNVDCFPDDFMFQFAGGEAVRSRSQIVTLKAGTCRTRPACSLKQ